MRKMLRFFALATALLLPLAACDDGGGDIGGADAGEVTLLLTDAPGDFEAAVVTISEIYLQGEGEDGERVVLSDETVTTDLLTLANDAATLVEDATVSAGTYSQLRFVIDGGYIVVEGENGTNQVFATQGFDVPDTLTVDGTLKCPSCAQTGIKVNLPGGAVEVTGEQKVLLVDFDVSQTFGHQAGASGKWVMHPTLEATDLSLSGTVDVQVAIADSVTLPAINDTTTLDLADFAVELRSAADTTNGPGERIGLASDGTVEFTYVVPGTYEIGLLVPEFGGVTFTTEPAVPVSTTVESGATAAVDFTITSISVDPANE